MAAMQAFATNQKHNDSDYEEISIMAYAQADAMMKERAKQDFSKDLDFEANLADSFKAIKDAMRAAIQRKHNITHHGNEELPQLIHQLETGLLF